MSVWLCIASARPQNDSTVPQWRVAGYRAALWRDVDAPPVDAEIVVNAKYPGYAAACNAMVAAAFNADPMCDWVVCGGDDVLPDPNHTPDEIARQCEAKFQRYMPPVGKCPKATYGVMQPTGDRWGDAQGAYIDRVAGSPWIGRTFWERTYGGKGPFWPEYFHMGADEEVQEVAMHLGVFWQRPDLAHHHQHWGRPKPGERMGHSSNRPVFLDRANSAEEWNRYKQLIAARKSQGWPGL